MSPKYNGSSYHKTEQEAQQAMDKFLKDYPAHVYQSDVIVKPHFEQWVMHWSHWGSN